MKLDRRGWIGGGLAAAGTLLLSACDSIARAPAVRKGLSIGENLSMAAQRLLMNRRTLAREYLTSDIAPSFRANGSRNPSDPAYVAHVANNFRDWRLRIDGLVETPLELSLEDLRAASPRTQVTRHDCVEGWSCIGKWTGARLGPLLDRAGLRPEARYLVFYCADNTGDNPRAAKYYESIDLVDAYHEQTILAYALNDEPLPVAHGAPVRLRVERQLGYKHAKFVMRIEAVESFAHIGRGKGGYWEDRGYEWYAGI
jgi:DMSO/TMAO reductase YedYZ molybdopterin-dependent catalytic subunit